MKNSGDVIFCLVLHDMSHRHSTNLLKLFRFSTFVYKIFNFFFTKFSTFFTKCLTFFYKVFNFFVYKIFNFFVYKIFNFFFTKFSTFFYKIFNFFFTKSSTFFLQNFQLFLVRKSQNVKKPSDFKNKNYIVLIFEIGGLFYVYTNFISKLKLYFIIATLNIKTPFLGQIFYILLFDIFW